MEKSDVAPAKELRVYNWRTDEYLLVDWYAKLIQNGDMALVFAPDMRYLGNFLAHFRKLTLGYACDKDGIFFACWLEPLLSGANFGVWVRENMRHAPTTLRLLTTAYNEAFKVFTVLLGLCKQPALQDIHRKLGYKKAFTIPALWNGEDVDVYVITQDMWLNRKH